MTTLARDESGISYVFAWVEGPNGGITNYQSQPWAVTTAIDRMPSEDSSTTWERFVQTIALRADAMPGRYRIWFSVGDLVGNRAALYDVTLVEFVIE